MGILGPVGPIGETPPGWVLPGAALDLDFANARYFGSSPEKLIASRASSGFANYTVAGNNNLLGSFAANVPRITDRGLLIEAAATNIALRSRDFANATWVATNVTVAQTSVGADGTANGAARLTAGAVNATILQTVTVGSAARMLSFWIKRVTGTGTIGICQNGVAFTDISAQLNTVGFTQVSLLATQLNPVIGIQFGTSGDAIDVDFAQLESSGGGVGLASSPIVTTSASATRNQDIVTMAVALGGSPLSMVTDVSHIRAVAGTLAEVQTTLSQDANNLMTTFRPTLSSNLQSVLTIGGATTSPGTITGPFASGKVGIVSGIGTASAYSAYTGTLSTTANPASYLPVTVIQFGAYQDNTSPGNLFMRRLTIWKSALSQVDLIKFTT